MLRELGFRVSHSRQEIAKLLARRVVEQQAWSAAGQYEFTSDKARKRACAPENGAWNARTSGVLR